MPSLAANARRIVVKVGSSLVTNDGRGLDQSAIGEWARQIADLKGQGKEVVLVSSGAIAEGMQRLGWTRRPSAVHEQQAAAAVGQMGLIQVYESSFAQYGLHTAQILLTHDDMADRKRYLNAKTTLRTLLGLNVIPVINENDTVVTEEIKVGDNDTLGALVANLIEADVLIILTDQAGLFTGDPRKDAAATFVQHARAGDPALEAMAGGAGSNLGRGGMLTKVLAAKRAARKQWLADHVQVRGTVTIDEGAARVLRRDGKSLLPIGIIACRGEFERGEVVTCVTADGKEVARGLANYSAQETQRILRKPSSEIETILGYVDEPELIHRDNLVLL
ncbi:MAG: glutamate 5-kinase [Acidobacteriota bacterium]